MSNAISLAVHTAQPKSIPSKKTLIAMSVLGTMIEYFDYSLYAFMAIPLSQYFFPAADNSIALLQAFGVFAIGSMAKPLGALIFGRIGDFRGRSTALRYSFLGISFPTLMVGCLPGYEVMGAWALFVLILCRLMQGIFVSGESDGVRIYLQEHFPASNHAFVSNLSGAGAYLGITMASLMAALVATTDWWRLPFFLSGTMGFTIFIVRQYLIETPAFLNFRKTGMSTSNRQAYYSNWKAILRTIMVCGASGGCYHLYMVFWGSFQSEVLEYISPEQATSQTSAMSLVYTLSLPMTGWIADRMGLYKVVKFGVICAFSMIIVNWWTFTTAGTPLPVLLLTTLSISIFTAPCFVLLTRQFEPSIRCRCLSIGHATGSMLFSGSTPALNMALWHTFQWELSPLLYFTALLTMGWLGMYWLNQNNYPMVARRYARASAT
jgi:MFS transporter, MHS family, proline/betaine transporter